MFWELFFLIIAVMAALAAAYYLPDVVDIRKQKRKKPIEFDVKGLGADTYCDENGNFHYKEDE